MTAELIRRARSVVRCLDDAEVSHLLADALDALVEAGRPLPVFKLASPAGCWEVGDTINGTRLLPGKDLGHLPAWHAMRIGSIEINDATVPDGPSPNAVRNALARLPEWAEAAGCGVLARALRRLSVEDSLIVYRGPRIISE